jgi:Zn-dependent peptidase ImmA (M78 family)
VQIPRHVRHNAFMGDRYARFTIAHELGHAALHPDKLMQGAALPRRVAGNARAGGIPKFKSAEHQANIFGAALLINDATARRLTLSSNLISLSRAVSTYIDFRRPTSLLRAASFGVCSARMRAAGSAASTATSVLE